MTGYNWGELRTQVANSLPPPDSFDLCRDCCGGGDFHLLRIISSIYVVMVTRARPLETRARAMGSNAGPSTFAAK